MQIDSPGYCCHEPNPAVVAAETCFQTAMRRQTRPMRPPPTMPTCAPGCRGRTWAALGGPGLRVRPLAATYRRGPASLRRPTQQVRQVPIGNTCLGNFSTLNVPGTPGCRSRLRAATCRRVLSSPRCPTQQLRQISTGNYISCQFRWFKIPGAPGCRSRLRAVACRRAPASPPHPILQVKPSHSVFTCLTRAAQTR